MWNSRHVLIVDLVLAPHHSLFIKEFFSDLIDYCYTSMSISGATGKDTSDFQSRISSSEATHENSGSSISATLDEVPDRFRKNAGVAARNKDRAIRRTENRSNEDVSEDERLLSSEGNDDRVENPPADDEEDDEFAALQNLSRADFRKVINFSLKSAAEAAIAATQSASSNQVVSTSSAKASTPFNRHAIVFKVADEISGDEIPRQEIPDCIWKLVQAKVPLTLPCITTASIRYIHNNPTSIKTTRSADGVSQSKDLMLDMSAFGAPEDISLADWQDAWINRLEIIKKTSERTSTSTSRLTRNMSHNRRISLKSSKLTSASTFIFVVTTRTLASN
jgi:hypothetical protein